MDEDQTKFTITGRCAGWIVGSYAQAVGLETLAAWSNQTVATIESSAKWSSPAKKSALFNLERRIEKKIHDEVGTHISAINDALVNLENKCDINLFDFEPFSISMPANAVPKTIESYLDILNAYHDNNNYMREFKIAYKKGEKSKGIFKEGFLTAIRGLRQGIRDSVELGQLYDVDEARDASKQMRGRKFITSRRPVMPPTSKGIIVLQGAPEEEIAVELEPQTITIGVEGEEDIDAGIEVSTRYPATFKPFGTPSQIEAEEEAHHIRLQKIAAKPARGPPAAQVEDDDEEEVEKVDSPLPVPHTRKSPVLTLQKGGTPPKRKTTIQGKEKGTVTFRLGERSLKRVLHLQGDSKEPPPELLDKPWFADIEEAEEDEPESDPRQIPTRTQVPSQIVVRRTEKKVLPSGRVIEEEKPTDFTRGQKSGPLKRTVKFSRKSRGKWRKMKGTWVLEHY